MSESRGRILIIDDDPFFLKVLSEAFAEFGFTPFTANDGVEGIKVFLEKKPDAVISDLVMPRMGGVSTCMEIRRLSGKDLPVIVLLTSMFHEPAHEHSVPEMGADVHIPKSTNPVDIVIIVEQLLERKKSHRVDAMPFIYRNIAISPDDSEESLPEHVALLLGLQAGEIRDFRIIRKGVDARRKGSVKLIYSVSFDANDNTGLRETLGSTPGLEWKQEQPALHFDRLQSKERIIIVGSGPAGLFTALRLAEYGLTATLIERGQPVEQRSRDVSRFWKDGLLDPESNVQFGEGGAGTFSDGKLTSRSKDPLVPWVLRRLADFGALPEVCYLAKPHIGTDRLRHVVAAIREYLLEKGFDIRFGCRLTDLVTRSSRVAAVIVNGSEELICDRLILATGHSARDTYELLEQHKVPLERKAFAIGLRVEHPQELIDRIQYGGQRHSNLPPADYAVAWNNPTSGRSAYSFCMCPGGIVIAGASEAGGVVTNGMSGQSRNSPYANSALVVNVTPEDFGGSGPLAGVQFQRHWERKAFIVGGGGFRAPAQNLMDFMRLPGKRPVSASYRPGIVEADLQKALPDYVTKTLREGIVDFGKRLRGFVSAEATLIGIESRTSAPVRIVRNEFLESTGLQGLYPTGEGAGYSGGIMSSAVDGVKVADMIAGKLGNITNKPISHRGTEYTE